MNNVFDKMCGQMEKLDQNEHVTDLMTSLARNCAVFETDGCSGKSFTEMTEDELVTSIERFGLPFQCVALSDSKNGQCVIFYDLETDKDCLLKRKLGFVVFGVVSDSTDLLCCGTCFVDKIFIQENAVAILMCEGERVARFVNNTADLDFYANQTMKVQQEIRHKIADSITQFLFVLMTINLPSQFVVEATPRKERPIDAPKIPRTHERKTYTFLSPLQIKARYGSAPGNEHLKHVSPHARRRHFRRLSSDKYVNKKGQIVEVKATWVGAEEWTFAGKKYRVRLDV